jgi:enolase
MILPVGAATFAEALRCGAEVFHTLKGELKKAGPQLPMSATRRLRAEPAVGRRRAGIRHGRDQQGRLQGRDDVMIGLDCAAPSSSRTAPTSMAARTRRARVPNRRSISADLVSRYPIVTIEDACRKTTWKAGRN